MTTCQNCKFFSLIGPATSNSLGLGECRRNPPKHPKDQIDRWDPVHAIFPIVLKDDWCGEFAPQWMLANANTGQQQSASLHTQPLVNEMKHNSEPIES